MTAGAVPQSGHIINLSRMDGISAIRRDDKGSFYITVQAGTTLSELREQIKDKNFDISKWSEESRETFKEFCKAPEQFFSPDPTETSATLGGMVACNASGARSYLYGSTRKHITAIKIALCSGHTLTIRRGEIFAAGRKLDLVTDQGHSFTVNLPAYEMPKTKNTSGYYVENDMDAIDLFIGSEGTLGIITDIEVRLLPLPRIIWGICCLFENGNYAVDFITVLREQLTNIAAIEFFDVGSLAILRAQKKENPAFARLRTVEERINAVVYIELHCDHENLAVENLAKMAQLMKESGGTEKDSWVARNNADRDSLLFFRHAVPESVNMLIDQRKRKDPAIIKLGTDMSVPDRHLRRVMSMYHSMLNESGLQSAIWGHIGDNHLHFNILPHNEEEYKKGQALYAQWAIEITRLGGAISAEHGIGKLKTGFLEIMYGRNHIFEMAALKAVFDPKGLLCPGNIFARQQLKDKK
ncbi:MAG: D-lactate dehydrogenase (Cytochrome) [Desulfotomaculum sp. 46_296]|nr:MAG: D-lactate dehydrogenase (Cytochrome) [Desulfotomaculum sp. 46_296]